MIDRDYPIDRNMRLDAMPPEYRAHFLAHPHEYYIEPFQVEGNLYFIGNLEIACYLIDSGDGLIIIDTGYDFCAGQLMNSIWSLGFNPKDIKMIFHTHNHNDHIAATNLLVRLSGAKTFMSVKDGKDMVALMENIDSGNPAVKMAVGSRALHFVPDVYTKDGDAFTLGNVTVKCVDTPGHSKGCQSFFFNVTGSDNRQYTAAIHGGIGINTLHQEFMALMQYPNAREDFFGHIERIVDWPMDIYLSSHTFQNYTKEKLEKRKADPDGRNPFIDPSEWKRILTTAWIMGHELIEQEKNGTVPEWQKHMYADLKGK